MVDEQLVHILLEIVREGRLWHLAPAVSSPDKRMMEAFREAWARIHPVERQEVVKSLVEEAEEHIEYDFFPILRWLLGDEDPEVRQTAIEGLWEDESPALIGPLLYILEHDPEPQVRAAAATGLGRFVLLYELEEISTREMTPVIERLIQKVNDKNEDIEVQRRSLEAISPLGEPHIRDLIEAAYYHPDLRMQASALFAMGRNLVEQWEPMVLAELESPEPELRYEAAIAAGEMELIDALPKLSQIIASDESLQVRLAAIEALGNIGGPESERILLRQLDALEEIVAKTAQEALDELYFMAGQDDFPLLYLPDEEGPDIPWE